MSTAELVKGSEPTALERLEQHRDLLVSGDGPVQPGQPTSFTNASTVGDCIAQGDLYLIVVDAIPAGYQEQKAKTQLVPGQTQGAKHCLDSIEGVTMHFPANWTEESMDGPIFVADQDRTVEHPVHGNVTVPAGTLIQCRYQREWDAEQARERRNAD